MVNDTVAENYILELRQNEKVAGNKFSAEAKSLVPITDFPNSKNEFWKYTRTAKLGRGSFSISDLPGASGDIKSQYARQALNIKNGFVSSNQNLTGIEAKVLSELSAKELEQLGTIYPFHQDIFSLAQQAYFQDCLFLTVEPNSKGEALQINLETEGSNLLSLPRIFICAEENSKQEISVVISGGTASQLEHLVIEILAEHNAKLELNLVVDSQREFLLTDIAANLQDHALLQINTLNFQGDWVRNNIEVSLIGEHAHATLNGLVMPVDKQHVDNHTKVNHCVANCTSSESYKNIVSDQATAIFNGKILVHQDAQKTNAYQNSANMLLSEQATVNAKPELEIYADDVKCSHGSTTGQLDEEALFYLQARGIPKNKAQKLLLTAFAGEVIETISN
ncbi:MAG: Fe-S cluster assembly protein SufD, partial [Luteibaculum sp.]